MYQIHDPMICILGEARDAKTELKRRRVVKNQKNSVYGINDGIDNDYHSNYLLYRFISLSLILEWE